MILEVKNGLPVARWHSIECARRSLGPDADIREVTAGSPEALALAAIEQAACDAEATERTDKSTLRDQIIGATEAQWLALTENQRQKIILKALKYLAKNL